MSKQPSSRRAYAEGRNAPKVSEIVSTEFHAFRRPQVSELDKGQANTLKPTPEVTQAPTLNVPEKSTSQTDSAYSSVDLPSNFAFYPFKQLSVRPLKAIDQAKLHQAALRKSLRHTVEAISSTLGDGVSAYDLTPQDFYFLMYWQRTNSFLKVPLVVKGYCTDVDHNLKVTVGTPNAEGVVEKLPESTLELVVTVNKTTLDVKNLVYDHDPSKWPLIKDLDLHVETMRDVVWAAENLAEITEDIETFEWLGGYSAFLRAQSLEDSLRQRIERLSDLTVDQISELDEYIKAVTNYGVRESTIVKCKECGASTEVVIPIDASSFFPHSR